MVPIKSSFGLTLISSIINKAYVPPKWALITTLTPSDKQETEEKMYKSLNALKDSEKGRRWNASYKTGGSNPE